MASHVHDQHVLIHQRSLFSLPCSPDPVPSHILPSARMHPYSGRMSAKESMQRATPKNIKDGTPTSQLVMSMASYCLDSPAFGTRSRANPGNTVHLDTACRSCAAR